MTTSRGTHSRELAVILHADIVDSTSLVQSDESFAHDRIIGTFELLSKKVIEHGGKVHEIRGDAIVAQFMRASDSICAALDFQIANSLDNQNSSDHFRPEVRIGISLGEVVIADSTVTGPGVIIAQRLEQLANPGGVVIQSATYEAAPKYLPIDYEYLGEKHLKGFDQPIRAYMPTLKPGESVPPPEKTVLIRSPFSSEIDKPLPEKPSIAVLPFRSINAETDKGYLADGIRLAIQASLVKASGLFLIGPLSVNHYRDQEIVVNNVAQDLGVRYVLEGSVQQSSSRIRITVQLTDALDQVVVWADQYDRTLSDVLEVQDEITAEVIKALDVQLIGGEQVEVLRSTLKNLEAIHMFYRGLNHFYARTREDNIAALKMFENVVRLQPDSPVGPSYLCMTHWLDALMGWADSIEESLGKAGEWAEKALSLDDGSGLADMVIASSHLLNRRHDEALKSCYRAIERRSSCPVANSNFASILHYCGRSEEAVARLKEAIRITPVYPPWFLSLLAEAYRESGEIDQSISAANEAIRRNPGDLDAWVTLCTSYSLLGESNHSGQIAREILMLNPVFSSSAYMSKKPYKDTGKIAQLSERLTSAGLPS